MLLGMMIMLLGGAFLVDPMSGLMGIEWGMVVIGLILGFIGFFQKD